jgi:ABC-type branched-subunit amino acid transport system ATPase component
MVLEVSNVKAGYGQMEILHGVSLKMAAGEVVTIVGPNGAGKSTLMKAIFGLADRMGGRFMFEGVDFGRRRTSELAALGMAYVPQVDNVFPTLTVLENFEVGGVTQKASLSERIEEMFELFPSLQKRRRVAAGALSGGERQLVAIGRALMTAPRVLMLDEPSAGLSPLLAKMVFEQVRRISEQGVGVLMIEQNARAALCMSHRGYVLAAGMNRFEGESSQLLTNPEVAELFVGGSHER